MFKFLSRMKALQNSVNFINGLFAPFKILGGNFPEEALEDPYVLGYINVLAFAAMLDGAGRVLSLDEQWNILEKIYRYHSLRFSDAAISITKKCMNNKDISYLYGQQRAGIYLEVLMNGVTSSSSPSVLLAFREAQKFTEQVSASSTEVGGLLMKTDFVDYVKEKYLHRTKVFRD